MLKFEVFVNNMVCYVYNLLKPSNYSNTEI